MLVNLNQLKKNRLYLVKKNCKIQAKIKKSQNNLLQN